MHSLHIMKAESVSAPPSEYFTVKLMDGFQLNLVLEVYTKSFRANLVRFCIGSVSPALLEARPHGVVLS